jgi:hypothetical protein
MPAQNTACREITASLRKPTARASSTVTLNFEVAALTAVKHQYYSTTLVNGETSCNYSYQQVALHISVVLPTV